ncbi:choice-of-anchor J domain-containing protein [Candidatus Sumerlaeota bacterium]|nr:choice-of-anchor J domain-containing protein [Candidatus Sumerlaeota bacterium]
MFTKNPRLIVNLVFVLLSLFILSTTGISGNPSSHSSGSDEILVEKELQAQITADDSTGYLIYFREKADLSPAYSMNWKDRGRFVMKALMETAKKSQARIIEFLDTQGASYQPFWVDNVIVVETSNVNAFNGLQSFPEIKALRARRKPRLVEPVEIKPAASSITAVESNLTHIKADQAWNMGYKGQGIVVANIDTGVRYTHDALVNQYQGNLGSGNYNHNYCWWDPYSGSAAPFDDHSHGSHTIGAMVGDDGGANRIGVAPGAKWIAARGFVGGSGSDAGLLSCGQFMAAPTDLSGANPDPDKRPHVVNNSWGDCGTSYDDWYAGVINSWHAAGIYPVFSNGNSSNCAYPSPPGLNTVGNPARSGNVTAVGATGRDNGQYANFSNWGPTDDPDTINPRGYPHLKPQVVAPGTNRSAYNDSNSSYGDMSGTSMATPHVSGLVALIWGAAPWLVGDYAATETIIEETANPIDYNSGGTPPPGPGNIPNYATGWGEIDALKAVTAAITTGGDSALLGHITEGALITSEGDPIEGALINAVNPGNDRKILSGADGSYSLLLWKGTYDVTFSAYGYQKKTFSNVSVTPENPTILNVALTPSTFYTIEGTVTDTATGWPLYAQIDIDGYPGDPVWTDPVTGFYSVDLAENSTYTLAAKAWVEGYLPSEVQIGPLTSGQVADIALEANLATVSAPGYAFNPLIQHDFEMDNGGFTIDGAPEDMWQWGAPGTWPGRSASGAKCWGTNLSGNYPNYANAGIVSPVMDLSKYSTPLYVSWWQASYIESASWDHAYAEVSVNGGAWQILWQHTGATAQIDWNRKIFDISAAAGGTVQFRFRLTSDSIINYAGYYVDNIIIASEMITPAGGLVVGNVYEQGINESLNDAIVSNEDDCSAITKATPDDPAVDDGFYTLYSPSGAKVLTAENLYYNSQSRFVNVLAGAAIRQDFHLEPIDWFTVEGMVDDSETGWQLYAQIEAAPADPAYAGYAIWTDPVTGLYSVDLPEGTTFTLMATAWVEGYLPEVIDIGPLTSDQQLDFHLNADSETAIAPGYTFDYAYFEDFETDNGGYTIDGAPGDLWQWGAPVSWPGRSASGAKCWGTNLSGDYPDDASASIVSPVIDLSGATAPLIARWRQASYIESATWDHAYAEVSVNGGGWQILWEHTGGTAQIDWSVKTYDLSAAAGGTAQFRFRLTSDGTVNYAGYYVDDIAISQGIVIPAGGLAVGNVYDVDTGDPLIDASVENEDGYSAFSKATPDDPAVDDGFYTLYSPEGTKTFTAGRAYYRAQEAPVSVMSGETIRQDFSLLPAEWFTVEGVVDDLDTGWNLYALIQAIPADAAFLDYVIWTDPVTGFYSLDLPEGTTFTLVASAWVPGYIPDQADVGPLTSNQALDIHLKADPVTCNAPGYTTQEFLTEGFETGFPPFGWAAYDIDGGGSYWRDSGTHVYTGSISARHASSDAGNQDGWLILPNIYVPGKGTWLSFWEYADKPASYGKHSLWIFTGVSSLPPTNWIQLMEFDNPQNSWRQRIVDLSLYAGEYIYLAFRYEGNDAADWYIDNVRVWECPPPSGGIVVGNVYDDDTGTPLMDATVENEDGYMTDVYYTPDDPAVDDGFYTLYSPEGAKTFTAKKAYLKPQSEVVSVIAGDTVRQDFFLLPADWFTLQGVVDDGDAGWQLYAYIQASSVYPGFNVYDVWTDPVTGFYSLDLPEGTDFILTATTWVEGYMPGEVNVDSLISNQTADIHLYADPQVCNAPGYATQEFLTEGFESAFPPFGWYAYDIDSGGSQWIANTGQFHSGSYSALHLSSDAGNQDGWLVLPRIPVPAGGAWLSFWEYANDPENYGKHSLWIHSGVYAPPPADWAQIVEFDSPQAAWRQQLIDLFDYAGEDIYLAFRYEGNDADDWYIDDIHVWDCQSPEGGLVVGNVYDANTGDPIMNATVENEDLLGATTKGTPDDPAVDEGFYTLYSPAGNKIITASKSFYASQPLGTSIIDGDTVRQDFHLGAGQLLVQPEYLHATLDLGETMTMTMTLANAGDKDLVFEIKESNLSFKPLSITTRRKTSLAKPIPETMKEDGERRPVNIHAETGVATGAPVETATPSGVPAPSDIGDSWETMTPMPSARVFNAVIADTNGYVYVIGGTSDSSGSTPTNSNFRYDTETDAWDTMEPAPASMDMIDGVVINNKIYIPGDGSAATTYVYDIKTDTWSSIAANNGYTAREQYQVVAIGVNLYVLGGITGGSSTTQVWILDTVSETWSAGAPMQKSRTSFSAAAIDGVIYVAGGVYFPGFVPEMTAEKFDGSSWSYIAGVPDGGGAYTRWSYNADGLGLDGLWLAGGRRDAAWNVLHHAGFYDPDSDAWTDSPTIPTLNQGRVYMEGDVASNGYFYVIGGRDSAGNVVYANNERLEVGYVSGFADAPWLDENPTTGTIAAGDSLIVSVNFDAGVPEVTDLGDYKALLTINANTPYGSERVRARMTVSPYGDLQGFITPQEAVNDGAQWRIKGEALWLDHEYILHNVAAVSQVVEFKDIIGWITPPNQEVTVIADKSTSFTAVYEIMSYALNYNSSPGGSIIGDTNQIVNHGDSGTTVTALPNRGYHFVKWSDESTSNPRQDINVTEDITVYAQFTLNEYVLSYIAGLGGTIDGETSKTQTVYHGGSGAPVTAIPDVDYLFVKWSDDATSATRQDMNVTSDITVTANFGLFSDVFDMIKDYILGITDNPAGLDINKDGNVDIADLIELILKTQ